MLFLIPPSETKKVGGELPSISQVSQSFGSLTQKRNQLIETLVDLAQNADMARRVLKLSQKQMWELEHLSLLWDAPTLPALQRYDGTLYDAIGFQSLSASAISRARDIVLIQSALFGLISADDRIPFYRLSATTVLPRLNLRKFWAGAHETVFERLSSAAPIIDLRSKSYRDLAPVPQTLEHYWVEVLTRDANQNLKALNHFNKKSKGELIRAILVAENEPNSIEDLIEIASTLGFSIEVESGILRLIIPGS